jgi:predicted DNA-binding transcriptional regulator YafY
MSDSLLRHLIILHHLPEYPTKVTTRNLLEALEYEGIKTSIRTIQRDLETLSSLGIFGISADKKSKPAGWYWIRQARRLQIPYMDINTAIAFSLIESQSESLLPAAIRDQIRPFFKQSNDILRERNDWLSKISRGKPRRSGNYSVDAQSRDTIYQALDKGKCISANIGRFFNGEDMKYITYSPLHPVGLRVEQDDVYLIAHTGDPSKITQFALYRFKGVKILEQNAETSKVCDLNEMCDKRKLSDTFNSNITLEIEVGKGALQELLLYPLGEEQTLVASKNNRHRLSVITDDDRILRRRLLSLGAHITVISPASLGAYLKNEAKKILQQYEQSSQEKHDPKLDSEPGSESLSA